VLVLVLDKRQTAEYENENDDEDEKG